MVAEIKTLTEKVREYRCDTITIYRTSISSIEIAVNNYIKKKCEGFNSKILKAKFMVEIKDKGIKVKKWEYQPTIR